MKKRATECKVCGSKMLAKGAFCQLHWREYATEHMRKARAAAKALPKKRCKAEGCTAVVATIYARYCAEHAPAAKKAVTDRAKAMLTPVMSRAKKAAIEAGPMAEAVIVPSGLQKTVLPSAAPSFRDYAGVGEPREYQRSQRR